MTPTLWGRIQTRFFLVLVVGVPWAIVLSPLLAPAAGVSVGEMYAVAFSALFWVAVVGIGWDFVYHLLQQYRWEKDWPTLFGLVTVVNEGIVVLVLLAASLGPIPLGAFVVLFGSTWILMWLAANGPMRVLFIRWRYRGGRIR